MRMDFINYLKLVDIFCKSPIDSYQKYFDNNMVSNLSSIAIMSNTGDFKEIYIYY